MEQYQHLSPKVTIEVLRGLKIWLEKQDFITKELILSGLDNAIEIVGREMMPKLGVNR